MISRVALDTNTLVSALLFRNGRVSWLRRAWQSGQLVPLVCTETTQELLRVLAYPKFHLEESEIRDLLGDYLPYAETVNVTSGSAGNSKCRDQDDQIFLDLASAGRADALIIGDGDLLDLADMSKIPILTPADLRQSLAQH